MKINYKRHPLDVFHSCVKFGHILKLIITTTYKNKKEIEINEKKMCCSYTPHFASPQLVQQRN